jgi:hypothetical protein
MLKPAVELLFLRFAKVIQIGGQIAFGSKDSGKDYLKKILKNLYWWKNDRLTF